MNLLLRHPLEILKTNFGYDAFRGRQAEVVEHVTKGGSGLVLMPTGGGKSLCFQIPALARGQLGLVISPLIALMRDQVQALRLAGVRAEVYNSSLDPQQKQGVRAAALEGKLDLLYVAPETLNTDYFKSFVAKLELSLIAVDEAHCVSQWGHDFRPDYLEVAALREIHPKVPLLALTATADPLTRKEIQVRLGLEGDPVFASSFDRPNIRYEIGTKDGAREQLLAFLRRCHPGDAGIVYCLSRKSVEETADWLTRQSVKALPYHAGLAVGLRQKHQDRFLREEGLVICATIAFGMGIDKPDVRFVAHLDLPKSIEGYYQETGRAGRDGAPASAWMAYGMGDVAKLRRFIDQGEGDAAYKRLSIQKLNSLVNLCKSTTCRRQGLLGYFGEKHAGDCGNCDNCLQGPQAQDNFAPAPVRRKADRIRASAQANDAVDPDAFDALRKLRSRLAEEQHLPPYVVFHDATLREMLVRKPVSLAELASVPGVGTMKLDKYGAEFLTEIARLFNLTLRDERPWKTLDSDSPMQSKGKEDSSLVTLHLFANGQTPDQIAVSRSLTAATVWNHLCEAVEAGKLRSDEVLRMPDAEKEALRQALRESKGLLKPVFERFEGKFPYDALKIVRAGMEG